MSVYEGVIEFFGETGITRLRAYRKNENDGTAADILAFPLYSYFGHSGQDDGVVIYRSTRRNVVAIYGPKCLVLDVGGWYACYSSRSEG